MPYQRHSGFTTETGEVLRGLVYDVSGLTKGSPYISHTGTLTQTEVASIDVSALDLENDEEGSVFIEVEVFYKIVCDATATAQVNLEVTFENSGVESFPGMTRSHSVGNTYDGLLRVRIVGIGGTNFPYNYYIHETRVQDNGNSEQGEHVRVGTGDTGSFPAFGGTCKLKVTLGDVDDEVQVYGFNVRAGSTA